MKPPKLCLSESVVGSWVLLAAVLALVVQLAGCQPQDETSPSSLPIDLLAEPARVDASAAPEDGAPESAAATVAEWDFEGGKPSGWWIRTYRGKTRGGPSVENVHSGSHAFCVESTDGPADADVQIHVRVEPSTEYRLEGFVRTFDLQPTDARIYGGFYLGEFSYWRPDERDFNDPIRWHPGLPRWSGTTRDWEKVVYDFRSAPRTAMVRLAASLGNWGGSTGKICFDDVRLIKSSLPSAGGDVSGATASAVEIGNGLRRGLIAHPRSEYVYALHLPEDARLSFETATTGEVGDGVVFSVEVKDGERSDTIYSRHAPPLSPLTPERTHTGDISLAPYAGRPIELVFRTEPSASGAEDFAGDAAYWIAPTVYRARNAEDRRREPNVILVTVDTLRPDHLGCYGYARGTSPAIDNFASDGVLFENAFTPLPRTTPALASMMTGVYPRRHGLQTLLHRLDEAKVTLAEILRQRGYATAAFVTHNVSRESGLQQGFDTYIDHYKIMVNDPAADAEQVALRAAEWLADHAGQKLFLWLHVWDPHFRYRAPQPYERAFDPEFSGVFDLYDRLDRGEVTAGQVFFHNDLNPRQVEHAIARYDGEIRYTDEIVGRFFDVLRNLGLYEDSLIVFASDHGESLGDHGYFFEHGEYLYDSTLRIPLITKYPFSRTQGLRVTGKAMLLDVAPTILAALGAPADGMDGQDLALFLDGKSEPHPVTFAETGRSFYPENPRRTVRGPAGNWTSVRSGRWKLLEIPTPDGPTFELYDYLADATETHDLYAQQRNEADALAKQLDAWRERFKSRRGAPPVETEEAPIDTADAERLRALGYMNAE